MNGLPRAIIFDFDGVIVDSEPMHERALRDAVATLGMALPHERYLGAYIGYDDRDCFRAIARDHGRTLAAQELAALADAKKRAIDVMIRAGEASAWPGAVELIREASRRGPAAVCSGARSHEIEPVLRALEVRDCFGAVVSADDVARSKPDPACYALTARRLGVRADECVAIEDTPTGAAAARGAGMRVVGVAHTLPADRLRGSTDRVFDRIAEITVAGLGSLWFV